MQGQIDVAAHQHFANHSGEAHALAVLWTVEAGHAILLQLADLSRHYHATTTAEHADVLPAPLFEQVDDVLEVLDVAPLVRADGDSLRVLLECRGDDLFDRAI